MRISYIGGSYVPGREANSMHEMRMSHALASLGHEVTLHARPGQPANTDDHALYGVSPNFRIVKHTRPQVRVYGAIANARSVYRWSQDNALPDLFYAREGYALSLLATSGVPFIYESHWKPKTPFHHLLEARLFRRVNFVGVVFISEALRQLYRKEFPWLDLSRSIVAHDAADIASIAASTQARTRLQVGYVGGFLPGYGIDVIRDLAVRLPGMDFHVVGGKEADLAAWRVRARSLSNFTLHGFVSPRDLSRFYARFDVMLAPYQPCTAHIRWISPMKLFEYMAHGKPIVCSDFPVIREVLENESDAVLVQPTELHEWEHALHRLQSAELRQRLGRRARAKLERSYTWLTRAARVLQLASSLQ